MNAMLKKIALFTPVIAVAGYCVFYVTFMFVNTSDRSPKVFQATSELNDFHYNVVQRPGVVISGEPVRFVVTVTKNGSPVANHKFQAGMSHAYGLFIDSRSSDVTDDTYTSDNNGNFAVNYTSKFWSLLRDEFGFYVAVVFTPEEQANYDQRLGNNTLTGTEPLGSVFDVNIYPRWLSWFVK